MALTSQQVRTPVSVSPNVAYKGSPSAPRPQRARGMGPKGVALVVVLLAAVGTGIGYLALRDPNTSKGSVLKPAEETTKVAGSTPEKFGPMADPLGGGGAATPATPPPVDVVMRPPGLNGGAGAGGSGAGGAGGGAGGVPPSTNAPVADPLAQTTRPQTPPVTNAPTLSQPAPASPMKPGSTQPGSAQPGSTQPGSTTPAPGQPGTGQSGTGQPGMTQPGAGGAMPPAAPPPSMSQVLLAEADRLQGAGKLVEARAALNKALLDGSSTPSDRQAIRARMKELNQTLVFSPTVSPGDVLCDTYAVVGGDNIEKIMRKQGLLPDKMLIARVNKMADPNKLSIGQKLKVVKGPFHAVVSKSQFRIDIYAGDAASAGTIGTSGLPDGAEPGWMYITSFPVGLGERGPDGKGGTPVGNFVVKANSKLVNPHWVNPRTGEKFAADNPQNPIGERWLGLEGLDDASKKFTGYGVHGTIDPASIGKEMSMGCVRLNSADIEVVYELLTARVSVVKIVP